VAAAQALAEGRVDALVSAGASGATVAGAVVSVGRVSGIRRPALAAMLPGPLVLLDVGAGLQVNPIDLLHHAVLGVRVRPPRRRHRNAPRGPALRRCRAG
jgi:glycerol-3-phosphate acyltransferase PlsX